MHHKSAQHLQASLRQLNSLQQILFVQQEGEPLCPAETPAAQALSTGRSHFPNSAATTKGMLLSSLAMFESALSAVLRYSATGPWRDIEVDLVQLTAADCGSNWSHGRFPDSFGGAKQGIWGLYGPIHELA